jgi:hypothetical protein
MRREIERLPETVRTLRTEREVREHVEDLNHRIRGGGSRSRWVRRFPLAPVDVDEIVAAWADARRPAPTPPRTTPTTCPPPLVAPPPPLTHPGPAAPARAWRVVWVRPPPPGVTYRGVGRETPSV